MRSQEVENLLHSKGNNQQRPSREQEKILANYTGDWIMPRMLKGHKK